MTQRLCRGMLLVSTLSPMLGCSPPQPAELRSVPSSAAAAPSADRETIIPTGDLFSCAVALLDAFGYTPVTVEPDDGFLHMEKSRTGALTGDRYFDEITAEVIGNALDVEVTTSREESGGGRSSEGLAPSGGLRRDVVRLLSRCRT